MKNQFLFVFILLIILMAFSCKNDNQVLNAIPINPAFENSPPIAEKISFEVLEKPLNSGENIRFLALFKQGAIDGRFLALNLNEEKVVLRDDGKGADVMAGDFIYSVFLTENIDSLKLNLIARQKSALDSNLIQFINRSVVKGDTIAIKNLNFTNLEKGKIYELPYSMIFGRGANDAKKTLMITDLTVVEDQTRTFNPCNATGNPNGVWTFGEIMRQLASPNPANIANDAQVSQFVKNWLSTWATNKTVNGEILNARTQINNQILTPWLNKSASNGAPSGQLKMEFAPFKLTAIVNRLDLRGNSGYGFSNAGEGRFVFTAIDLNTCEPLINPSSSIAVGFNVIFEFGINKKSCSSVKAFAQEWLDLNTSTNYNQSLELITKQFTQCGTNINKPNQSSLNQLRTNEVALDFPWELREFNLTTTGLTLVPVKMEPAVVYNAKISNNLNVDRLVRFINQNTVAIQNNNYTIPNKFENQSFLGGKAVTIFPPVGKVNTGNNLPHHWGGALDLFPNAGDISSYNARHIFSLNTCSGCHGGETQTGFTHIDPVGYGTEATLSGFLTGQSGRTLIQGGGAGNPTIAPIDGIPFNNTMDAEDVGMNYIFANYTPTHRSFNDLLRRENDLTNLVNINCNISHRVINLASKLRFEPVRFTH